jgi:hypothetical protein
MFAPAVNPSGLVKGVEECFDFVAGLLQLLNCFAKLARSGSSSSRSFSSQRIHYHNRTLPE